MLKGKKILLGISGSIAAYKAAFLTRLLIKAGAEVKIIMTPASLDFVTPLTLSTLSKNPVLSDLSTNDTWADHVHLGRWADLMMIAPLSCNTLAKMAAGRCDNLLLAVYLSATCPVAVAPAMDEDMWLHSSTNNNIAKIAEFGNLIIPVEKGELASGLEGEGRMAEPEMIISWMDNFFLRQHQLSGKKVMVTAGPTYEPIDPVRFIGNHSSGKMGIAIADACRKRGAEVTLIIGPSSELLPPGVKTIRVTTAAQMYDAAISVFPIVDIAVLSAAVADYSVQKPAEYKIKKTDDDLILNLVKTKDILKTLGQSKKSGQLLVGFALETDDERSNALKKLKEKNADIIILNSLKDAGAGFGYSSNRITIFDKSGNEFPFSAKSKKDVAEDILDAIIKYSNE